MRVPHSLSTMARQLLAAISDSTPAFQPKTTHSRGYGGGMHTFTINVYLRGSNSNWGDNMVPQEIRAYSLREALQKAQELPLSAWFPDEEPGDDPVE